MTLVRRLAPFRDLALIIASASLSSATISLAFPLLSIVLERHGHDPLTIGINSAGAGLAVFIVAPLLPMVLRAIGAVRTMAASLAAAAALLLLFPLHVEPWLWFGLRVLLGCAGATLFIVSEAGVNALCPPELRGRVIAAYATSFSIGHALGPILLALVGSRGWAPFVVASALLASSLPPLLLLRSLDGVLAQGPGDAPPSSIWRILSAAPLPFVVVLVYIVIEASFFALLPVYALSRGLPEAAAATLLGVWIAGNIVFQLPIGSLGDRWSRARVAACCALGSMLLLLLLPASVGTPVVWPLFLVMGGGMGALYALSLARLGDCFAATELTRANTVFAMAAHVGLLAGPPLIGAAMRATVPDAFAWALAAPLLVVVALCFGAPSSPRLPAPTAA